jgi:hypothetical protein
MSYSPLSQTYHSLIIEENSEKYFDMRKIFAIIGAIGIGLISAAQEASARLSLN